MTLFETILSDDIIRPVGWTLVHFLWQATIAAAILWGLLQLFAKASSNVRYAIACVALLVMVIMPAVTFCVLYEPPVAVATVEPVVIEPPAEATVMVSAEPIAIEAEPFVLPPRPLKAVVAEKIEAALPACVLGWFIGVAALSLWYLGGWCQLQKLRRIGTKAVSEVVATKASELADRLGIRRGVQIVESALVQVPTVIGALKPIVLLPATALTGLDEIQLSALIAHELAHVKRCDYLVNILQTIVEILGFYHPALWWISRQIRLERENCCDDMAVALLQNKKDYAGALFTMETIRSKQLELAVAANGGSLTDRITRLADKEAKHPKSGWIPSVVTILLASALLITTAMAISNEVKKDKTPTKQEMAMFFVEAWQALESGNDKNIDNYFYFENDTIRQKALPYLKPELGDFSDIDNVHILDISMSSDGAYQVFTLNPVSSTVKTYLIFRRLIVYEDGRYKLKMCTQEWFDQRMIISGSESEKEAVRKIAEDKINEWKAAAGDALDALVQSRIQEYERALTAIQYAKVHNLKLVPLNAEEINKELDRLRKTPPEQLKQEFIAEWTAQLEELTETASSENSKVFRKATKSSGNGKRLEFRLVADTPQELADEVEWPESNVDGYQWMKLKPQTDDNWHRNALCRQVGDDIYLLVSNKADETMRPMVRGGLRIQA
ncbi:MAG: M56 family metallopeptidase [Planctomycetota bacterium]|jgi:beta-lactamase regulating signal transducer with metallopeptidase domain